MYSYISPYSYPSLSLSEINQGTKEGIYLRGVPYQEYVKKSPNFVVGSVNGSNQELKEESLVYRQPFVLSLKDISVVGVRTILDKKGNWLNDQSYADEADFHQNLKKLAHSHDSHLNEATGFQPTAAPQNFTLDRRYRMDTTLRGKTLMICSLEPEVYGSWIFRILPKLHTAKTLNLEFDRILLEPRPHLLEYFDLLGLDRQLLTKHDRNVIYHLEHAIIPSMQNSKLHLDQETLQFYAQLRGQFGHPSPHEKIYISRLNYSRKGSSTRILLNEELLIEALEKEGFKIIFPETLSIKEQIKVFSSARFVVGPSGSALFNMVFCYPGTKLIDIESEPFHLHAHCSLFSSLDLDYGIFFGTPDPSDDRPIHKRWTVDIEALITCVKKHNAKV